MDKYRVFLLYDQAKECSIIKEIPQQIAIQKLVEPKNTHNCEE